MVQPRDARCLYCAWCQTTHTCRLWYKSGNVAYCHYAYVRLQRRGGAGEPIAWLWLSSHLHDVDASGHRIAALQYRPDIQGMISVWALMCSVPAWASHAVFACGFALQLYWQPGMIIFAHELLRGSYVDLTKQRLLEIYDIVEDRLSGLRVVQGVLRSGSGGRHPTTNPAERRGGAVRYRALAREYRRWAKAAALLQAYLSHSCCAVPSMLRILRSSSLRSYSGSCSYGNVRLVRSLIAASGAVPMDSPQCWSRLSSMSPHLRHLVGRWGLDHEGAMRLVVKLRHQLGVVSYSLHDLVCFLCLASAD